MLAKGPAPHLNADKPSKHESGLTDRAARAMDKYTIAFLHFG
jgi:hypothetical protein